MFNLYIRPEAKADLLAIKGEDARSFAKLMVLLEEINLDRDLLKTLAEDGETDLTNFTIDVTPFGYMQKRHFDMWRIKAYEFGQKFALPYRLIYAVDNVKMDYHLFAVMKRKDDYENDPSLIERIRNVYLQLGLPFVDGRS